MLSHHSKVLALRIDLHMDKPTVDNKPVSMLIRKLRKKMNAIGHKRMGVAWCREQATSEAQHYHLALFLNGNVTQHPFHIITLIEQLWMAAGHPKPFTPKNCYAEIKRGDREAFQEWFFRLTYLAKIHSKGKRLKTVNDYSLSRLKPKVPAM